LAVLVQVIGQMTLEMPMDYLKWTLIGFACIGFFIGIAVGPRPNKT
jgi:hypothetical protein